MTRRTALGTLAGFPFILRAQKRRPNILFLMTDDQRFDAMSCAGNRILQTPNMDRIARDGVRFSQAFVSDSLCSPSRATIVTGIYSHAHGVRTNGRDYHTLRPDQVTFPMLLQKAGYHTALVGKWHVASPPTGFDFSCILPGQGVYHDPVMIANGGRVQLRGYVDDLIADQALETLKNRPKNQPFCLLCQFKAPHRSWQPAERFQKRFEDVTIPEPPTFNLSLEGRPATVRNTDLQIADMPDFHLPAGLSREERKKQNFQHFMKNYYRVLLGVDENVGRLLDFLDKQRLAEDTLIIYTSDNGFFAGEYGMFDKRLMYEPSIRVPMLARYPGGFRGGRADGDHMVLNNDVAHTILDYAGVEKTDEMRGHGESWRPILEERPVAWRDAWMYEYFEYPAVTCTGKIRGIRTKRWKYIHYIQEPQGYELFDLEKDPEERRNLYGDPAYQAQAAELKSRLERMRDELKDDRSEDGKPAAPCTIRIANLPA